MSTKDNNNKLYVRVGIVHFFEKNKKKTVTPFSFIQSMNSLHGIAGPNNHAKQNLRKVGKLIGLNTSKRDVHSINNTLIKEINKSYSAILYPAFRLQKQFQTKFLGVRFWNKKKIAFTKARKHLIESNFQ